MRDFREIRNSILRDFFKPWKKPATLAGAFGKLKSARFFACSHACPNGSIRGNRVRAPIWNFDTRFVNFRFHSGMIYWRHNVGRARDSARKMHSRRPKMERKDATDALRFSTVHAVLNFEFSSRLANPPRWHAPVLSLPRLFKELFQLLGRARARAQFSRLSTLFRVLERCLSGRDLSRETRRMDL